MSFEQYTVSDYVKAFRRRGKLSAAVFLVVAGAAAAFALSLPDTYTSRAEFQIDLQGLNIGELRPVETTNYADQYVRSLQQEVLSYENRRRWLEESNLYADRRDEADEADLVAQIARDARVELVMTTVLNPGTNREVNLVTGFVSAFDSRDPEAAHFVADRMAEAFLAADRSERARRASAATSFLEEEIAQKREEIADLSAEIADFKEQNSGMLPEMRGFNMTSLERAEANLATVENEIRTAEQDLIYRRSQLEEARRTSASAERLQQLEEEYLRAVSIYGPEHPDVMRIRRQVAALTGGGTSTDPEVARLESELASMRERYSDQHPDVINTRRRLDTLREQQGSSSGREPTDVRYLQLSAEVNAITSRLQGLRERADDLRGRIETMDGRLARMPQIERAFLGLQRELETAQIEFDDLRRQAADARQTEAFETGERGARIQLISSARVPMDPSGPPRAAILVLGILFGTTLAMGAGIGAEAMDTTVRSSKDIVNLLQTRPIAAIPIVENSVWRAQKRRRFLISAVSAGIVAAALLALYSALAG